MNVSGRISETGTDMTKRTGTTDTDQDTRVKRPRAAMQRWDQTQHMKNRPDVWIGSTDNEVKRTWVYDRDSKTMVKRDVRVAPALTKLFHEILANATDQCLRDDRTADTTEIRVTVDSVSGQVTVRNDGDGLDVVRSAGGEWSPTLAFGVPNTSTNYDADSTRQGAGQNGIGAKAVNLWSDSFEVETVDAGRDLRFVQRWTSRMDVAGEPSVKSARGIKPFTRVTFVPDYRALGCPDGRPSEDAVLCFEKMTRDAAAAVPGLKVWYNGAQVGFKTLAQYAKTFLGSDAASASTAATDGDRSWEIVAAVDPSGGDGFEHVTFVNGIHLPGGGTHVTYVREQLVKKVRDRLSKKTGLDVSAKTVADHLTLFVRCRVPDARYEGQVKDRLTTPAKDCFGAKLDLDDAFVDKLCKCEAFVARIKTLSEATADKRLKKSTDGKKVVALSGIKELEDANLAGTRRSKECTLIVVEGLSAMSSAIDGVSVKGKDRHGVFSLKGKPLNVRGATSKALAGNVEFANFVRVMGLKFGKAYDDPKDLTDLRYGGGVLILADADTDGIHICGLVMNWFHYLWPSLLKRDFVRSLRTPIVKAFLSDRQVRQFYDLHAYEAWIAGLTPSAARRYRIKYYKGLGTSTSAEAKQYFKDDVKVTYTWTGKDSDDAVSKAFDESRADDRKAWLSSARTDVPASSAPTSTSASASTSTSASTSSSMTIERFVDDELSKYSLDSIRRQVPCVVDGFVPSHRKILYTCLQDARSEEIKVDRLASAVGKTTCYHHGEMSLHSAIKGMAMDFVGVNNVPLLEPRGNFGSRLQGGKDAAAPRYISTVLSPVALKIFKPADTAVLDLLTDDGQPVEPAFFVPVIPMLLVNGAEGIATGWSTSVPCHRPSDVIAVLRKMLAGRDPAGSSLDPWYRGFTGDVRKVPGKAGQFQTVGRWARGDDGSLLVTELPVGVWVMKYRDLLDKLVDAGTISGYRNESHDDVVRFVVDVPDLDDALSSDGFEKTFGLVKGLSARNMNAVGVDGSIRTYATALDVVRDYYPVRLEAYVKRRNHQLGVFRDQLSVLANRIRFVDSVVSGDLVVRSFETRAQLDAELKVRGFDAVREGYEYLTGTPMYALTAEHVAKLRHETSTTAAHMADLEAKTPEQLWSADLDELEAAMS